MYKLYTSMVNIRITCTGGASPDFTAHYCVASLISHGILSSKASRYHLANTLDQVTAVNVNV